MFLRSSQTRTVGKFTSVASVTFSGSQSIKRKWKGDLQKYLGDDISGSAPTTQRAKKRNILATEIIPTGTSDTSSTTASTSSQHHRCWKHQQQQQLQHQHHHNITEVRSTGNTEAASTTVPTSKQQPLQLQPYSQKYDYMNYDNLIFPDLKSPVFSSWRFTKFCIWWSLYRK